jgi:hypothetical protein
MKETIYKAIMVPEDLHQFIKVSATDEKKSIIEFINNLMYLYETKNNSNNRRDLLHRVGDSRPTSRDNLKLT